MGNVVALFLIAALAGWNGVAVMLADGSLEGIVVDEQGRPLQDATVYAIPGHDIHGRVQTATDAGGRFTLVVPSEGDVYLHAFKASAGYPDNFFSFFKTNMPPMKYRLTSGQVMRDILITLGPKAARLTILVMNSEGVPIPEGNSVQLIFKRDDVPGYYRRGGGARETILVPPVPFRLVIESPGYKPWRYGTEEGQAKTGIIALKPGEMLSVTAHLTPLINKLNK
jgi:hypothetical protein